MENKEILERIKELKHEIFMTQVYNCSFLMGVPIDKLEKIGKIRKAQAKQFKRELDILESI